MTSKAASEQVFKEIINTFHTKYLPIVQDTKKCRSIYKRSEISYPLYTSESIDIYRTICTSTNEVAVTQNWIQLNQHERDHFH